jgi:hypothetical protein
MRAVTNKTPLSELKLRVRAAEARGDDLSARLVRSVQQSLRVEGYTVAEEVIREALRRAQAKAVR